MLYIDPYKLMVERQLFLEGQLLHLKKQNANACVKEDTHINYKILIDEMERRLNKNLEMQIEYLKQISNPTLIVKKKPWWKIWA